MLRSADLERLSIKSDLVKVIERNIVPIDDYRELRSQLQFDYCDPVLTRNSCHLYEVWINSYLDIDISIPDSLLWFERAEADWYCSDSAAQLYREHMDQWFGVQ